MTMSSLEKFVKGLEELSKLLGVEDVIPSEEEIHSFLKEKGFKPGSIEDVDVTFDGEKVDPELPPWPIFDSAWGAISNMIIEHENVVREAKAEYAAAQQDAIRAQDAKQAAEWQLQVEEERLSALRQAKSLMGYKQKTEDAKVHTAVRDRFGDPVWNSHSHSLADDEDDSNLGDIRG